MIKNKLEDLLTGLNFESRDVGLGSDVTYISRDSRDIPETGNPLFFAIRGKHIDSNLFIDDVWHKNRNAIILSEDEMLNNGIVVEDLSLCMAVISRRFYQKPDENLNIVAVTGTNGKTTIGFLVRHILNTKSKTGLIGTIEYDLGGSIVEAINTTPLASDFYKFLQMGIQNGCQNVVLEASSHAIAQNRIFNLGIDVAIFTNLSQEHLDYHQTIDQYFQAKTKMFDGRNGRYPKISLVNIDDEHGKLLIDALKRKNQTVFSFGEQEGSDFQIVDIQESIFGGSSFGLKHEGKIHVFETKMFGKHNFSNITASICSAYYLGHSFDDIRCSLGLFDGVPGRLEKFLLKNGALVFVDYAHTPDALKTVLNVLHPHVQGDLITVFGCGGDRDRSKRIPMTNVVTSVSDYAIATADNPRTEPLFQIFDDMKKGQCPNAKIEFINDRRLAIEKAIRASKIGDVILIAGRGHENDQKLETETIHFNDREVVCEINKNL